MPDLDELWYQQNRQPVPACTPWPNLSRNCDGGIDGTRNRNRVMLNPSQGKGFRL